MSSSLKTRISIAWVNGKMIVGRVIPSGEKYDLQDVSDDFGVPIKKLNKLPRGYISDGEVDLFVGEPNIPMNIGIVHMDDIITIKREHSENFRSTTFKMYNGGDFWGVQ